MIKTFIDNNKDNMIQDVIELINIPTVFDKNPCQGGPFGQNVKIGLEKVLKMAEDMGMEAKNIDGYAGEITIGKGDYVVGILGHIDVVEGGEDWLTDPFVGEVKDNKIYGRGSTDDKGPIISCLYAMKYLLDNDKIPDKASIRMIVGTNEEEDWKGIEYYVENTKILPNVSIVPDGYFPLIFCEKGLIDFDMRKPIKVNNDAPVKILELKGGTGRNIVAAKASCKIETTEALANKIFARLRKQDNIKADLQGNIVQVVAEGKATHAMSPEKGINGISIIMKALGEIEEPFSHEELIDTYNRYIGMTYNGENFGCDFSDEVSGRLTMNVGVVRFEGDMAVLESNLRYPASMELDTVMAAMNKTMEEAGLEYVEKSYIKPICIDKDSDLVKKLMTSYRKTTGDMEHEPFAIGGATYARAIPNAVAFGPLFPDEEELAHEANEFLAIDSLVKMTEIYGDCLELLMK
ncbi:MAG: dipeptidase PepV [Anaerovoracaceae bacterium]